MGTIDVAVNWPAGDPGPTPDQDPIDVGERDTKIRWNPGENVSSVDDIGGLPEDEFTQQGPIGGGRYQVTDKNSIQGEYDYTIQATQNGGTSGFLDPKIRNGG